MSIDIDEALELVGLYDEQQWWFDPDSVLADTLKQFKTLQTKIDTAIQRCDEILIDSNKHEDNILYIKEALTD